MIARILGLAKVASLTLALLIGWVEFTGTAPMVRPQSRVHAAGPHVTLIGPNPEAPPQFHMSEFVLNVDHPIAENPFTDVVVYGVFTSTSGTPIRVNGFADSEDGSLFRLRFTPLESGSYDYAITYRDPALTEQFIGRFNAPPAETGGFVRPDPAHPYSFRFDNGQPFFPAGIQAWTLGKQPSPWGFIDQAASYHHNVLKVWLLGAPAPDAAPPCTACSTWSDDYITWPFLGTYHQPDYTRFDLAFWQRLDTAIRDAANQHLHIEIVLMDYAWFPFQTPDPDVQRFMDYALARYSANPAILLWEVMNEWDRIEGSYNGLDLVPWVRYLGTYMHDHDPYSHPVAVSGGCNAASFPQEDWTGVTIIHGCTHDFYQFTRENRVYNKPVYMDEAAQENKDPSTKRMEWWKVAMGGGFINFRSWIADLAAPGNVSGQQYWPYFARFWEGIPYQTLDPHNEVVTHRPAGDTAYALADPGIAYVIYLLGPAAGPLTLSAPAGDYWARWYDTKQGLDVWGPALVHSPGEITLGSPSFTDDIVLHVWRNMPPPTATATASPTASATTTPSATPSASPPPTIPLPSATPTPTTIAMSWSGDDAVADSWLLPESPAENMGAAIQARLRAHQDDRLLYRALKLADVPPSASVVTATLCLHVSGGQSQAALVAYPVRRPWSEMSVTYDSPWELPGLAPPDDYLDVGFTGEPAPSPEVVCFDLTALVQAWLAGFPNDGIVVRRTDNTDESYVVGTSEGDAALVPVLRITYAEDRVLPCALLDVNHDGAVDIVDIQVVAVHWNAQLGDANFSADLDVDSDGDIDLADAMLVARRWGTSCSN